MAALRTRILQHFRLAALLVALALCLKAAIPPGYMIATGARTLTVLVCADSTHRQTTMRLVLPSVPADDGGKHQAAKDHGLCPFAGFAVPALSGADPLLLLTALAIAMVLGLAAVTNLRIAAPERWRPPLRGPPAAA